jgi:hypothetical protein
LLGIGKRVAALRPEQGAETVVYLASAPGLDDTSGGYFVRSALAAPSDAAQDDGAARRLWDASERFAQL